jgi:acyl-CoA thioester hydrolase
MTATPLPSLKVHVTVVPKGYEQRLQVGWSHLDANGHMANTAYLDLAANVRVGYFAAGGFSIAALARAHYGPVIRREELEFFRELRLEDDVRVTLLLAGLSDDASRFQLRNEFWRGGELAARLTSLGGWLDLRTRRLAPPPAALAAVLRKLVRTADYQHLPPSASGAASAEAS